VTFKQIYFSSSDGLQLYARVYEPQGSALQTVVCLAGLTRNSRDFDGLAVRLASAGFRVITVDMRGRGASAYAKNVADYNLNTEAQDVLSGLAALGVEHAAFIGTSRGGLILHVLAGMRPTVLKAVILNDIGPAIEPDGLLQIRRYLENTPQPKNWADAIDIQKAVHSNAFPILSHDDWERHTRAIYKEDGKGNVVADYDKGIAQTLSSLQADTRLPTIWPQYAGLRSLPMMVIRGEHSRLLSQKTFEEMGARHPNCTLITALGQGHAPVLDVGDLPEKITGFLKVKVLRQK
jgi:pimeloyl-ACP methyl ester carboxylesterase